MPGPGSKKAKAKPKNRSQSLSTSGRSATYAQDLIDNVYNAEGWDAVVAALCAMLDIPDLTTRSGLKKIHKDFEHIHTKLDDVYTYACRLDRDSIATAVVQDRLRGAVVAAYASMSADAILREHVFRDADFLAKATPLLDNPALSHIVLQALGAMTHHGGLYVRYEVARKTPAILRLLDEQPDDAIAADLAMTVISHSLAAVVQKEEPPDQRLLRAVDLPRVLRTVLAFVRRPGSSRQLVDHGLGILSGATQHCSKDFYECPSAIDLLVACARSPDIRTRATGVGAILRLHILEGERDDTSQDPRKLLGLAGKPWPEHIVDPLMDYGMMRCETFLMTTTARDYQQLMMKAAQDHDLVSLGLSLVDLIARTEYSIAQGRFEVEDPRTGKRSFDSMGLPFTWWLDALPQCARALRERGGKANADPADILDLKFYVMKSKVTEAHTMAREAIKRSPNIGFYYYVLTLGAEQADGLREAKKGLKCPNLTPYVRFGLLYRAAEHAADMAVRKLQDAMISGQDLEEGYAFAMSALEDSNTFIMEAPPDTRSMKAVLYIHTLMLLLVKGDQISPELTELEVANGKLQLADDISRFLERPISKTQMRLARATFVARMPAAWREWGDVVSKITDHTVSELSAGKAENDLATWLEHLEMEDTNAMGHRHDHHFTHPTINLNTVELYRCSWCGNPSAILRKCRGCLKTRYCDADCQKQHWAKSHKKVCTKSH